MKSSIVVRTSFEGIHQYTNAPEEVDFLRHPHRHMFYVEAEIEVIDHLAFVIEVQRQEALLALARIEDEPCFQGQRFIG